MDSFLQNHQASLDRQREEEEIAWLFPPEDFAELIDFDDPLYDSDPKDHE